MKCFETEYSDISKVELHCHLEGSIRTGTIIDIATKHGIELPSYDPQILNRHVKVREQLDDLQSVLDAFAIAQRCLVSTDAVERIAFELFEDAAAQNIKLFEVRFSPDWAFTTSGLDWDDGLGSILKAKRRAETDSDIAIGLIVVSSRNLGRESCERTIAWAIEHKDVVHGVDLADSETDYPVDTYAEPISKARDAGLRVTIHTGEDTPASAVIETIEKLEPNRIGHGIHAIDDLAAVELLKSEGIVLEICPWSNYLTSSVERIEDHPLKKLFDAGVKTTINSDDPETLDTNLNSEYRIAHDILGMSWNDIASCNRYALEASFLPAEIKRAVHTNHFS
jgi:adenosine deaminase